MLWRYSQILSSFGLGIGLGLQRTLTVMNGLLHRHCCADSCPKDLVVFFIIIILLTSKWQQGFLATLDFWIFRNEWVRALGWEHQGRCLSGAISPDAHTTIIFLNTCHLSPACPHMNVKLFPYYLGTLGQKSRSPIIAGRGGIWKKDSAYQINVLRKAWRTKVTWGKDDNELLANPLVWTPFIPINVTFIFQNDKLLIQA